MTWNKWLVFTKISYYGIEQHITLTLSAWRCLITVRIIWAHSTPPLFMRDCGVEVCLSLHVPYIPGSIRTEHFVVSVIFYLALLRKQGTWDGDTGSIHCFTSRKSYLRATYVWAQVGIFNKHTTWKWHVYPFSDVPQSFCNNLNDNPMSFCIT